LALLGGLFLIRSRREWRPNDKIIGYVNIATVVTVVLLGIVFCSGGMIYSANRYYQSQQSQYVRPAPRPDYSLPVFPVPTITRSTPTYDPNGKYLAGRVVGSIDHLRVGDVSISQSPSSQKVLYIQFSLQAVECLSEKNNGLTTYAIDESRVLVLAPPSGGLMTAPDGRIYASQPDAVVQGKVISPEEIMGTVYLRFTDSTTHQTCDLGTFEWDAFVTGK
jgi:hypothetical protein